MHPLVWEQYLSICSTAVNSPAICVNNTYKALPYMGNYLSKLCI